MRVSLFTGPYPVGERMGGIGLRMWEIALGLRAAGHCIRVIAAPGSDVSWSRDGLEVREFGEDGWQAEVEAAQAVITTDLPDPRVLLHAHRLGRLIISENAPPIEHLHYDQLRDSANADRFYEQLVAQFRLQSWVSDHFLARSEVERAGMYATLVALGRLTPRQHAVDRQLHHLVSLVPIGFSPEAATTAAHAVPTATPADYAWSGGVWDFTDTGVLCQALAALRDARRAVSVRFCYPPPANQRIAEADRLHRFTADLGLDAHLVHHDRPLPHTGRDGILASSRALVCLGRPGAENETCHRLRLRDVLLHRMPIVIDSHGASGSWVARHGVGLTVDTTDVAEVAAALDELIHNRETYAACRAAIDVLRPAYRMDVTLTPLLNFLHHGRRAPDTGGPRQKAAVERLFSEVPAVADPIQLI
ncbi:glycosyltransferase family 4 protein [Nonomuraea sp. FMUSA5-5]|uniref:Glycosyltransferase family 4 protein n=1 Tax=Nonomuraea composti TaxID=2720023 RepID=A0ABX1BG35_9ACTN|nr:glycosyltransferase family 4 protein [Nonomuraea sp. FMUSA5-5]NJP95429.1 glycosyltransferase family 4 protein [Nonomuraea sp. FMUSA5-5]